MGNTLSSRDNKTINIRDVIIDDEIKNYDDATTVQFLHYKDQEKSPNHLIGYKQNISFKITNYIKYDNGLYLYKTSSNSVASLFGESNTCDILKDIKIQNENVKLYIQLEVYYVSGKEERSIFEAENFELNYARASCFNFLTFIFVSKDIVEEFNIYATKYIAGPELFRQYIVKMENPMTHIHITNGPLFDKYAKCVFLTDIIKDNFHSNPMTKEKKSDLTPEKIEKLNRLKYKIYQEKDIPINYLYIK